VRIQGVKKILLIDDEEDMDWLLKKILNEAGYDCLTATTGKEGVEIFDMFSKEIGAVILDLKLPDMNGWEVLDDIKSCNPLITAIIITAFGTPEARKTAWEKKVYRFVDKPFKVEDMLKIVEDAFK
jgi:DNA-binding NtrC family response regulator